MSNKLKRFLSLMLVFVMVLSIVPANAEDLGVVVSGTSTSEESGPAGASSAFDKLTAAFGNNNAPEEEEKPGDDTTGDDTTGDDATTGGDTTGDDATTGGDTTGDDATTGDDTDDDATTGGDPMTEGGTVAGGNGNSNLRIKVAQIGETRFNSLKEAVNAAAEGQTIMLLTDVEMSSSMTIDKAITLDLNGKTIILTHGGVIKIAALDKVVTISNGTVKADKGATAIRVIAGAEVALPGCTVDGELIDENIPVEDTAPGDAVEGDDETTGDEPADDQTPESDLVVSDKEEVAGAVAQIGETTFASLAEAVAAAQNGDTIKLIYDFEQLETVEIPAGLKLTLDLNGRAITSAYQAGSDSKHIYPIRNYGDLTITGSGSITGRGIYNQDGAILTVNGAKIVAEDWNGGACVWGYGSTSKVYLNNATLIGNTGVVSSEGYVEINGGTYTCYSSISDEGKIVDAATYNIRAYNGLKITDGTFTSRHGVLSVGGGTAVVEGGSFTIEFAAATTSNVVYVYGDAEMTINGGSFESDNTSGKADSGAAVLVSGADAKLTINDGTFVGMNGMVSGNENTVINAGSFSTVFDYNHYGDIEPYVTVGKTITVNGVEYTKTAIKVATFEELVDALATGEDIILTEDITTTAAISTVGIDAIVNLDGHKLTIGAGDNKFNDETNLTIENGTIDITGLVVKGNGVFCLDEYEETLKTTLTLNNVNMVGEGYSSAYGVFYIGPSSTLNVNGGVWKLSNDAFEAGGLFKSDSSAATLNISGATMELHNVRRVVTYAATSIENTTMKVTGDADGVDAEMEHGFNRSPLTIIDSTITMSDMVGRGITAQNGAVDIINSTITMTNCQEATIDVRNGQTVTIDATSNVTVDAEPTITSGEIVGTVNVVVPPAGTITYGFVNESSIWGEATGNAKESFVIELYVGETRIATSTLNNIDNIIDGDVYVTWSIPFAGSTGGYWTAVWEAGYPNAEAEPTKVVLVVDGEVVAENSTRMSGPDGLNPVVWKELDLFQKRAQILDADGNVLGTYNNFERAIAAACSNANVTRIEILQDITQESIENPGETYVIGSGRSLSIGAAEGESYTVTLTRAGNESFSIYQMEGSSSLTIDSNVKLIGLDIIANGFATAGDNLVINGDVEALSLKQWSSNGEIIVNGNVKLGYGDGQLDLAYGNGSLTVNGSLKAGYSGTRGNGNVINVNGAYDAGAWFNMNGSNGTINVNNAEMKVAGGDASGKMNVNSTGNNIVLTNNGTLTVATLALAEGNKITINAMSKLNVKTLTGAGSIVVDAAEMKAGDTIVLTADMTGFTGAVEVINNDKLEAVLEDNTIVLSERKLIEVTYPDGTVEYYADMLEAVPYTSNCPRLEGAIVKLLADIEAPGIRMMENGMVLNLNGFTYTITAGIGSQGTNTSGFQIRPEVTTVATIKNGTINVAEGAPVVWMFNNYATDFVVENVTVDCTNMAWSYGESCYVHVSRAEDSTQFTGSTQIINFNAEVGGAAINVGGTMTIADTAVSGGTIELDAGAKVIAREGLDVMTTADGYTVSYADGAYTCVLATVTAENEDGTTTGYASLAEALEATKDQTNVVINLLADATLDITAWQTLAIGGDATSTITINGNGNTLDVYKKNSDWNHIATNNGAKLILNNMTITDSGYNDGPWNRYDINFACTVELNNVISQKALAFKSSATLNNVTINESGDNYAIWIQANGQTVSINGLDVNSAGRGIKIDEQYVDAAVVNLTVKNADFDTAKKAAIMVKSSVGANVTVENVDISGVAADTTNAVWNDEDAAVHYGKVKVNGDGVTKAQEGDFAVAIIKDAEVWAYYKTLPEAVEAVQDGESIELAANVELTEAYELPKSITLETKGYTLTGELQLNDAVLTLTSTDADLLDNITTNVPDHKIAYENGVYSVVACEYVAEVGGIKYETIDEAVAHWTNGTTLTLLADVTLSDVIKINTADNRTLNLSTFTMTAASGKNAIEIIAIGTGDSEQSTITINADATNPGGINAGSKSVIYYDYSKGNAGTANDRPIIKINNGVFTGSTSSFLTAGIYTKGSAARKCATINISGGTFNCSILGTGKSKMLISGGTFNYSVSSQGDSTCYRLISGGTFKTLGFMTADSNNTKFWIGTSMANSNVGVYIDANGYLVVGGPVIKEPMEGATVYTTYAACWNNLLTYSSASDYGLNYLTSDNNTIKDVITSTAGQSSDQTVILYTDATLTSSITVKNNLTLTLNGNTLTHQGFVLTKKDQTLTSDTKLGLENVTTNVAGYTVTESEAEGVFVYKVEEAYASVTDAEGNVTCFVTLEAAVAAAQPGETVTLLKDVKLTDVVTIEKAITLDLGECTLTGADGAIVLDVKAATTIKNGTITGDKSGTSSGLIDIYADLTMDGVTVTTSKVNALRFKAGECTATLTDCTVTGAFKGYGGSVWNIKSGTYMAASTSLNDQLNGTAAISGGTFHYEIVETECAPGYTVVNNGDGTWTVKYAPACFIDANNNGVLDEGEAVYASLEPVFANHKEGNVYVVLTADIAAKTQVDTDVDAHYYFSTNVADGAKMDFLFADDWNYVQNMTVGEYITLTAPYLLAWTELNLNGKANVGYAYFQGAKVTVAEGAELNVTTGDQTIQVKNGANLTVNGTVKTGTINVWVSDAKLTVSGANAKVDASWIDIWDGTPSVVVENGATLTADGMKASRGGTITVDAATLDAVAELGHNGESKGEMTIINNGTIAGAKLTTIDSTVAGPEGLTTITTDIADHKVVYENGVYKVTPKTYVAETLGVKYETLEEALEAAKGESNIVVNLLADATLDITAWQTLAIGGDATSTITINGNGNTLDVYKKNSDWNHIATNNGAKLILNNMTITDSGYNNGPWNRYDINFACPVELNNVTSTKALAFKSNATLNNVTINESGDNYAIWIQANGQTVTIDGLDVNSAGRGIKIDEQYVDAAVVNLTVKNADFDTAKKAAIMVKSSVGANVTVENVDISGVAADTTNVVWNDEDAAVHYGKVKVNGVTKAQEGDFAVAIIKDAEVWAYYKTLPEAVEAVQDGESIELAANVELAEAYELPKSITLETKGYTLTGELQLNDAALTLTSTNANLKVTTTVADCTVMYNNSVYSVQPIPELPTATVTELDNANLTFALNFKADPATDEQLAYYGNWYADFVLTVNKEVTFNGDGSADGYLSGQYDAYDESWLNVPFENVTMTAGESLKIMEYAASKFNPDLKLTYNDVYSFVKDFNCGVFFTDEYLENNLDLVVTLELRMYNPEDETENYVIGETYIFMPKQPAADMTYSAYGFKTSGEGDAYRERFGIDLYNVYARKTLEIKLYDEAGNLLATTSVRETDRDDGTVFERPIEGNKTANIVVDGRLAGSWDTEWVIAPSVDYIPYLAEIYADGKLVDTYSPVFETDDVAEYAALPGVAKVASVTDGEGNVTYYGTLDKAFAAAEDGDVVTILVAGTYELNTSGKDITITGDVAGVVFDNIGAKNMGSANVTFNNVTFDYYPNVNYTGLQHSGNLTYNNCTFNGQVFLYGTSETFTGCTFNQNSADAYNVWTYGAKNVKFAGCTFNCAGKSVLVFNEGGPATSLVVDGSTFNATGSVEGKAAIEIDTTSPNNAGGMDGTVITITDTTATGFATGSISGETLWNDKKDQANLDVYVDGEHVWPIFVAQIGETKYTALQSAIDAAEAGDTVTVLKDIVLKQGVTIASDDSITLDLAGYTVSMTDASTSTSALITNNGTLKITGEGKLSYNATTPSTSYSTSTINNKGTLTVDNGTFENTSPAGGASYVIDNYGNLTVNGGSFSASRIVLRQAQFGNCNNTVTINGGTFTGYAGLQMHVFSAAKETTATINGGTFDGTYAFYTSFSAADVSANTKIVVNDGTFTGDAALYLYNSKTGAYDYAFDAEVKGGYFDGWVYIYAKNAEDTDVDLPVITGGTYTIEPAETIIAEGYIAQDNGNGTWTVIEGEWVAQIGETKYTTLQAAADAAINGDTVVLLTDIAEDVVVEQKPDVKFTINGDGKTIDGTITVNGKSACYATAGLTIQNVNFHADTISKDAFINLGGTNETRYTSNVTVTNCTFTAEPRNEGIVAIKQYTGGCKNLTVANCTATGVHSLIQLKNVNEGLTITDCTITDSKNGISVGNSVGAAISGCTMDVDGYGIRADGNIANKLTVSGCTIDADMPIVVRKTTAAYELAISGSNTLTAGNAEGYQVIFTNGDDGTYEEPTGAFVYTADEANAELKVFPTFVAMNDGIKYTTFEAALAAAKANDTDKTVILLKPVAITEDTTYDLSGVTVTSAGDAFIVTGGTLTLNGNGVVEAGTSNGTANAVWANGGNVVINGGTYSVGGDSGAASATHQNDVIYTKNGGTVSITGGTFLNDGTVWTLNQNDSTGGAITVTGGTFQGWNPADNVSEGANTNFVAEGYKAVDNGDGSWTVVEDTLFDIYAANVRAGDSLDMFFYVQKSDLDGEEYYAEIVRTFADGSADDVVQIPYSSWTTYSADLFRFGYDGIAAKEMTDEIYVTIYNSDGTEASNLWTDSVTLYTVRMLKNATGELRTALVDMVNYGAAAQQFFGYNTSDLANAEIGDYQQYATPSVSYADYRVKGDNYAGSTVSAENRLVLTFYFRNITPDMTATITYKDHYGSEKVLTPTIFKSGTLYGAPATGLAIADGRQLVTCEITDASGNVVASATDSVESYVARQASVDAVFDLLMRFVESAYIYFH